MFMLFRLAFLRLRRSKVAHPILLCMGLLDEVIAGFPVVALPLLRSGLNLSYTQVGLLFTAGALAGMIIEPFINLLSDRRAKKLWILCGLLILAVSFLFLGNATSYALLLLAYMVYYPAGGAAVDLSQAVLIDARPGEGARTMTRWTLLSSIGDFLSPLIVAAFVALGFGWNALCWLAAALWLFTAALLSPLRFPLRGEQEETSEGDERVSVWAALREALRDPRMLRWAALTLIPTMLDEIFVGFVSLYLHDALHVTESLIALILMLQMVADFLGLFLLDRLLKHHALAPVRTLFWLSLMTLSGVAILLVFRTLWSTIVALLVISFSCAGWYPLAMGEAYASRPNSSGVVRAVIGLGAPLEMALPGMIGLVSASFGVLTGLGLLCLAPVLMLLLLPYRWTRRGGISQKSFVSPTHPTGEGLATKQKSS